MTTSLTLSTGQEGGYAKSFFSTPYLFSIQLFIFIFLITNSVISYLKSQNRLPNPNSELIFYSPYNRSFLGLQAATIHFSSSESPLLCLATPPIYHRSIFDRHPLNYSTYNNRLAPHRLLLPVQVCVYSSTRLTHLLSDFLQIFVTPNCHLYFQLPPIRPCLPSQFSLSVLLTLPPPRLIYCGRFSVFPGFVLL